MDPYETAKIQLKVDTQAGCGKRCVPNITFFFFFVMHFMWVYTVYMWHFRWHKNNFFILVDIFHPSFKGVNYFDTIPKVKNQIDTFKMLKIKLTYIIKIRNKNNNVSNRFFVRKNKNCFLSHF